MVIGASREARPEGADAPEIQNISEVMVAILMRIVTMGNVVRSFGHSNTAGQESRPLQ